MNWLKTTVLLAGLTGLLLALGAAFGGETGMVLALGLAVVMNFGAYWYSDKLVLKMHHAREVSRQQAPELYETVEFLARRAGLPMPRVYIIQDDSPNAFATGRNPQHAAVAATTGLMRTLSRDELAGVMAHELSHVYHRDILISTVAATIAGAIAMLANMAQWALIFGFGRGGDSEEGGGGIGALVMMILAPVAAGLIQMAVSRSREYAADKRGAELCGNPLWLANALRKLEAAAQRVPMQRAESHPASAHLFIVNPLRGRDVAKLFSTHPPIDDRVQRLEQMAGRLAA
ncbi:MAG TPA: zinc metalloprotease HtpX [Gammaproteobacteria bacterium]|nr:zinc metalloprotease HtpX [Gammaproteobacteria bacterium]